MSSISISNLSQLSGIISGKDQRLPGGPRSQRESEFNAAAKSLGLNQNQTDALRKQVDDAIELAKQGKATPGARDTIKNAMDGVLRQNGIDPKTFHAALHKAHQANTSGAGKQGSGRTDFALSTLPTRVQPALAGGAEGDRLNILA